MCLCPVALAPAWSKADWTAVSEQSDVQDELAGMSDLKMRNAAARSPAPGLWRWNVTLS